LIISLTGLRVGGLGRAILLVRLGVVHLSNCELQYYLTSLL